MSSFTILPKTNYKFIILPETTNNDYLYMSEQEKTDTQNINIELYNKLKTELEGRNAELEIRKAELEIRKAELEEKLKMKDEFILKYWETMKNNLIVERKQNKELEVRNTELEVRNAEFEVRNTELERDLVWYHKQCSRQRS